MKNISVLLFSIALLVTFSSADAYTIANDEGRSFYGSCDSGSTFAGTVGRGSGNYNTYTVLGPRGTKFGFSRSSVIRKACGE